MINYIIRRLGYGVLILIGVNLFTFVLFFTVNTPDDMARMNIGGKRVTQDAIEKWKVERGYNKPLLWNAQKPGVEKITDTIFYERSVQLFAFRFGASDSGRDIGHELRQRVGPSIALAIPTFLLGIFVVIVFSLLMVFFRSTYLEFWGVTLAVFLLSISGLFYIIVGQFLFSKTLKLVPISGFSGGWDLFVFLALPIVIGIVSRMGGEALFYRTMFLEEVGKDYVRTARSKGLSETTGALPPRAAQRAAADPDQHRRRVAAALPGRADHGIVLRHTGARQLYDRRHQFAGFRRRALDGIRRLCVVHRRPDPDRHLLHRRRSTDQAELGATTPMPKLVFLATDIALYVLVAVIAFYVWHAFRTPTLRQTWRSVLHDPAAMSAGVVLAIFLMIAMLDSFHFRPLLPPAPGAAADAAPAYSTRTLSVLDALLAGPREAREKLIPCRWDAPVLEGIDAG